MIGIFLLDFAKAKIQQVCSCFTQAALNDQRSQ